jgi:anti-sigma B factor antagonist
MVGVEQRDGFSLVTVSGAIDGKTAPQVQEQLRPVFDGSGNVVMDMSGVDYMSSAGLRLLLLIYRDFTARRRRLVLAGIAPEIKNVMQHTGFLGFFTVADDVEAASAQVQA